MENLFFLGVPILEHITVPDSYCITPNVGVGVSVGFGIGVSKTLKFYAKVFYVMGRELSGELSRTWTGLVKT